MDEVTIDMFDTPNEFSIYIEKTAIENGISYLEAILEYCENHMLEPSDVAPMINESLKGKLEVNYQDLNYLPKGARLV